MGIGPLYQWTKYPVAHGSFLRDLLECSILNKLSPAGLYSYYLTDTAARHRR